MFDRRDIPWLSVVFFSDNQALHFNVMPDKKISRLGRPLISSTDTADRNEFK